MEEQLITFETAKLAKEKGFDVETNHRYLKGEIVKNDFTNKTFGYPLNEIHEAPTQSLLQKWLRKTKGFVILVYLYDRNREDIFSYEIVTRRNNIKCGIPYLSYEQALEAGLLEVLN